MYRPEVIAHVVTDGLLDLDVGSIGPQLLSEDPQSSQDNDWCKRSCVGLKVTKNV